MAVLICLLVVSLWILSSVWSSTTQWRKHSPLKNSVVHKNITDFNNIHHHNNHNHDVIETTSLESSNASKPNSNSNPTPYSHSKPNVLLYVTTHLSQQHRAFLETCWPVLSRHSILVQESHVLVFVTKDQMKKNNNNNNSSIADGDDAAAAPFDDDSIIEQENNMIRQAFSHSQSVNIHRHPTNPGLQAGAVLAMTEAFDKGWFQDYDWVIRLNPDVIVRDDSKLLAYMNVQSNTTATTSATTTATSSNSSSVQGIFVDCHARVKKLGGVQDGESHRTDFQKIHTDFFAFRPMAFLRESSTSAADTASATNTSNASSSTKSVQSVPVLFTPLQPDADAESTATSYFQEYIVSQGADRWIWDSFPSQGKCRVGSGRKDAPIHHYTTIKGARHCAKFFEPSIFKDGG